MKSWGFLFFKRVLSSLPSIFFILFLVFLLVRLLPGDPILALYGERGLSEDELLFYRKQWGFDKPLLIQFVIFFKKVILYFDWGVSTVSRTSVLVDLKNYLSATLELSLLALSWSFPLGYYLGKLSAQNVGTKIDKALSQITLFFYSIPVFWLGAVLVFLFAYTINIFPVSGRIDPFLRVDNITGFYLIDAFFSEKPFQSFLSACHHIILPALVLGTIPLAIIQKLTRVSTLQVSKDLYIQVARSKGLPEKKINSVHIAKNAFLPIFTSGGVVVASLISGAVLTETLFSWPGMGRWLVTSLLARDYFSVQAAVFFIGIIVVLTQALVDSFYGFIDPRVKS